MFVHVVYPCRQDEDGDFGANAKRDSGASATQEVPAKAAQSKAPQPKAAQSKAAVRAASLKRKDMGTKENGMPELPMPPPAPKRMPLQNKDGNQPKATCKGVGEGDGASKADVKRGGWFSKCQKLCELVLQDKREEATAVAEDLYAGPERF